MKSQKLTSWLDLTFREREHALCGRATIVLGTYEKISNFGQGRRHVYSYVRRQLIFRQTVEPHIRLDGTRRVIPIRTLLDNGSSYITFAIEGFDDDKKTIEQAERLYDRTGPAQKARANRARSISGAASRHRQKGVV